MARSPWGGQRWRLGVDGKPLLPPRAGIYRYLQGLLAALTQLDPPDFQWEVITPRRPRRTAAWVLWDLQWATAGSFDLFHFPFYYPPLLPRCPVTVAVHDHLVLAHPEWFPRRWGNTLRLLIPRGVRQAAAVVTGSLWVAEELSERCGIPLGKIRVIPYGVDLCRFAPPPPSLVQQVLQAHGLERPYLLQLGALEPRRGVDLLLLAAQRLRKDYPQLEVVLAGEVRAPVTQLENPPPWVRPLGFVPDGLLPALLWGAQAVVAPSRGEGFDLPVLEALACGACVVASDIPPHREHFAGGVQFFASGSWEDLAQALQKVLGNKELNRKLRQAGRTLALSFTWERAAQAHLALWREVVCGQRL